MKKKEAFIVLFFIIILFTNKLSFANDYTIKIHYFGTNTCISCLKTEKHIETIINKFEIKNGSVRVELVYHDTLQDKNNILLVKYNNYFNIKEDKFKLVPAIFIGDKALIGQEEIEEKLEDTLNYYFKNFSEYKDHDVSTASNKVISMTTTGIILAGLIDGINPCSIAMMLFFISYITMNKSSDRNNILYLGISFSLGTFLAYFGIGIGLFKFLHLFKGIKNIMKIFYLALAIMGLYISIINIQDYKSIKSGKEENIKNQLNKQTKRKIHNIIKKQSNQKLIYITGFFTAFLISFLEFFCTGQVYLPVITCMINNSKELNYILLLLLYNLAFITPLLLITLLIHLGKEVIDVSTVLYTRLHIIKIVGAVFFFGVFIYSIIEFIGL